MTSQFERETFLRRWRDGLRDRQRSPRISWEGRQAYADLRSTGYLTRVRIETPEGFDENSARYAFPKICSELVTYKKNIGQVRKLIEQQEFYADWLTIEEKRFRQKAKRCAADRPDLSLELIKFAKKLERLRLGSQAQLEYRWSYPIAGWVLPKRGHEKINQERELDSWFQIRLGSILRSYLPKGPFPYKDESDDTERLIRGPSLRTIARLIVFFLLCAGLAEEKEGSVRLNHSNREITVPGVLQQLRKSEFEKYVGIITVKRSSKA